MRYLLFLVVGFSRVMGAPVARNEKESEKIEYNNTYPLTTPMQLQDGTIKFRIAIITDMDKKSLVSTYEWKYNLHKGWVTVQGNGKSLKVKDIEWDEEVVESVYDLGQKGRGMEMSALEVFNGKLYTCDDKTGMVYELVEGMDKPLPFVRLNDGDGRQTKPFKCEWMTVKDQHLYVGSIGQEWVNKDGKVASKNTFWVKIINEKGEVVNSDWFGKYDAMREKNHNQFPGYFVNEAVNWSDKKNKWFLLPRKESTVIYEESADESRCTNKLFTANQDFSEIEIKEVGDLNKEQGFSAFKFIPGSDDEVFLALKTVEVGEKVETWMGAFNVDGEVVSGLVKLHDDKYEGLEFI